MALLPRGMGDDMEGWSLPFLLPLLPSQHGGLDHGTVCLKGRWAGRLGSCICTVLCLCTTWPCGGLCVLPACLPFNPYILPSLTCIHFLLQLYLCLAPLTCFPVAWNNFPSMSYMPYFKHSLYGNRQTVECLINQDHSLCLVLSVV